MVNKIKYYKNFDVQKKHKNSIILIGNFDGVHLGHQKLFKKALILKKRKKYKIGVVTFDPIPKMFFFKKIRNYRISNFDQKLDILKKFKVDFVINKKFDLKFFEKKFNYRIINPSPLKKKKKIISSTSIRKLLEKGQISTANKYLDRNWSIQGIVKFGRRLGKTIGFPTCNIDIGNYVIAKPGVYAVKILINKTKKKLSGIANLGYRPTFNQNKILLEVNIFNFKKNLYNKKLTVEFLNFIRGEKKFNGIDELKKQIKIDVKIAKKLK